MNQKDNIMNIDFNMLVSLWKNYNNASKLLVDAMDGTNNEVGEFAEKLVAKYYNANQLQVSNKSADLETPDKKLVQVKSRKMDKLTSQSLGVIRSWDFDILVVVLFDKFGNILKALEIKTNDAKQLAKENEYQNGFILTTSKELLENSKTKDLTKEFQNILEGKISNHLETTTAKEHKVIVVPLQQKRIINQGKHRNSIIDDEVKKIQNRIPGWFQNKNQYNSRILYAFIKLVNKLGFVSLSDLQEEANFTTFMENYNQMKNFGEKNHGKIFEERDGKVYFWDEVKDYIWNYYEKYIKE